MAGFDPADPRQAGWLGRWRADGPARRVDGRIFQGVGALPIRRAC